MATIYFLITTADDKFIVEHPWEAEAHVPGYDFNKTLGKPVRVHDQIWVEPVRLESAAHNSVADIIDAIDAEGIEQR